MIPPIQASSLPHFEVCIYDDFPVQAAARFRAWCHAGLARRRRIHAALTGGRSAEQMYAALGRSEPGENACLQALEYYQGDERPVPPENPESNWGMAVAAFLDPVGVPLENRHRMIGEAADLDAAARDYEALLRRHLPAVQGVPAFDLVLLGMGDDGHIASLFPGTPALAETQRLVVANPVAKLQKTRLTLTFPAMHAAREIWILVGGAGKAEAVHRAVDCRDAELPVTHLRPASDTPIVWMLDAAAAGALRT